MYSAAYEPAKNMSLLRSLREIWVTRFYKHFVPLGLDQELLFRARGHNLQHATLLLLFTPDSPIGARLLDDLLRELGRERIVVRKMHVKGAACGSNRIEG